MQYTADALERSSETFYRLSSALNRCLFNKQAIEALLSEAHRYVKGLNNPVRLLMICWQAASLCFQQANYEGALDFIRAALHRKADVRIDLQFQLCLLQSEAHQRLGNDSLSEYLALSTRRIAKTHKLMVNV